MNTNTGEKLDESKTNGLITKIWGPHFWETLHVVSFGYPLEPTEQNKLEYAKFYIAIKNVLPCRYCRESYTNFILHEGRTKLTTDDLKNRETLTKWVYKLHNRVNEKLGVTYGISYEDMCQKYESYRAKCVPSQKSCNMPLHLKANSFRMGELKHSTIIDPKYYHAFKEYAKLRGIHFDDGILDLLKQPRNSELWEKRDKLCWSIIKKMRLDGIPSVEKEGEFKNLPTQYELKLIKMMSTNICCDELEEILKILGDKIKN